MYKYKNQITNGNKYYIIEIMGVHYYRLNIYVFSLQKYLFATGKQ